MPARVRMDLELKMTGKDGYPVICSIYDMKASFYLRSTETLVVETIYVYIGI